MWEKFSYYGMRAILVYYMMKQLGFAQTKASFVYGLYTGLVYLTPVLGAVISDRWLGARRAVVIGGAIMAAGHFMMGSEKLIYPALATIAIGNGLYLPNLPAQVPSLYSPGDPRARGAMNVYYVGINLGAFLAPLAVGTVGEVFGWHYGFALAGVGMLVGLTTYLSGRRHLPLVPTRSATATHPPLDRDGQRRIGLMLAIVAAAIVFRAGYEQIGNTIPLWLDGGVDRRVAGFTIPMTWFLSFNPLLVFALTPVLVARWSRSAARGREPSTARKMATGAAVVAGAYLLLATATYLGAGRPTNWGWAAGYFFLLTLGELYLLPVALGLFARIAPGGYAASAIAIWYSAAFVGSFANGLLGGFWTRMTHAGFFATIGAVCLAPAFAFLMFGPAIIAAETDAGADEVRRVAADIG